MSLPGAVDGSSRVVPTDRPGRVVRAGRSVPARPRRSAGRVLAVLLAVALGAGGAIALLVVAVPGALASVTGQPAAAEPGAPTELVLPAVVASASSCVGAGGAQDAVVVELDGARHQVPLDGCGSIVGTSTTVRVLAAADPTGRRAPQGEARVLGTGGSAPLDAAGDGAGESSPMASRITVTLTVVAGVAMAGLLVALGRESARTRTPGATGTARTAPAARPADPQRRPGTTASPTPSTPSGAASPAVPSRPVTGPAATPRARSRARSLRAPHPARAARGDGRRGPGAEGPARGSTAGPRTRRPR